MAIVGHGIDVVDVQRFEALVKTYEDEFQASHFTEAELNGCGFGVNRYQRLAGRFAAKEAVLKALGTGLVNGIAFTDVEILANSDGTPRVVLHAQCLIKADEMRVTRWMLSISHTPTFAVASAIAVAD
jgi:holo-[acyl-carrier protein] synthase